MFELGGIHVGTISRPAPRMSFQKISLKGKNVPVGKVCFRISRRWRGRRSCVLSTAIGGGGGSSSITSRRTSRGWRRSFPRRSGRSRSRWRWWCISLIIYEVGVDNTTWTHSQSWRYRLHTGLAPDATPFVVVEGQSAFSHALDEQLTEGRLSVLLLVPLDLHRVH